MLRALAVAAIMLTVPSQVIPCGHPGEMVAAVTGPAFQEQPLFEGVTAENGFTVRVFANGNTGTWTLIVEQPPLNLECVTFAGKKFKPSGPLLSPPL